MNRAPQVRASEVKVTHRIRQNMKRFIFSPLARRFLNYDCSQVPRWVENYYFSSHRLLKNHFLISSPRAAFTLIELLTVIAIIGILAAIIIPTVGMVRKSAQNAVTVSNLRQLIMADLAHAADYKDLLIPNFPAADLSAGWFRSSECLNYLGYKATEGAAWTLVNNPPYGSHYVLSGGANENYPEVLRSGRKIRVKGWEWCPEGAFSIGMNMSCGTNVWEGGPHAQFGLAIDYAWKVFASRVKNPGLYIRWGETAQWNAQFNYDQRNNWVEATEDGDNGALAFRSGGKAAVAYLNGKVGYVTKADINVSNADRLFKPLVD